MRNGQLDNEEKARAVLCRTGRPGNPCHGLDEDELAELAAIYDACLAPELALAERVREFWGRRHERQAAAKPDSLFRGAPAESGD
ncbi:MAG TPA: hypothetical protein PKC18_04105 [Lacipirellulaceae bacterium]|nr:hypothetical protein [Lacipirellulaceae bacterium]HMP07666.1 hypothetical protein [Lacipirellulaceae bacterium]